MKLGISGQALGEVMDFEAIVDVAARYGISHFELWPCNVPGTGFGYRDRDIEVICDIIRRRKITIDCVTLEAAFCEPAVESADAYVDMLMGTIDAAAAVGAGLGTNGEPEVWREPSVAWKSEKAEQRLLPL